jgi:hypothetical protein
MKVNILCLGRLGKFDDLNRGEEIKHPNESSVCLYTRIIASIDNHIYTYTYIYINIYIHVHTITYIYTHTHI